jgi:hypothetical protein
VQRKTLALAWCFGMNPGENPAKRGGVPATQPIRKAAFVGRRCGCRNGN